MIIAKVGLEDVYQLQTISIQTFSETFRNNNKEKDLNKYIHDALNIDQLKKEINQPNTSFYFAYLDGRIIGFLKINTKNAQTELIDMSAFEIERIYVLAEFQGKNLGQKIFNYALEMAKKNKASYLWLGVWEANEKAIRFYKKNGMIEFDKHLFKLGNDLQTDLLFKLTF